MKYFELQDSAELKYAPKLLDWYGKFDVRNITLEGYPKLPKQTLFIIEPSKEITFTDIILFPFLLVSPLVRQVITMYQEICFFRNIILLDQFSGESRMYYLPVFSESNDITLLERRYKEGICISDLQMDEKEELAVNMNLFWVRNTRKRHTIISLDLAESLIRRDVTGLGLSEVILYDKN